MKIILYTVFADEDYFIHSVGKGIDFRNNTEPVTDKDGFYSTNLFTEAVQETIEKHDSDKVPFFIYAAYQSVHEPLEAPQHYIYCRPIPINSVGKSSYILWDAKSC